MPARILLLGHRGARHYGLENTLAGFDLALQHSADGFEFDVRATRDHRVCLLLTHRPSPMTETLEETRRSLLDRHGAVEIELGPLADGDVDALIRHHVPDPGPELVARIGALSRGLPFAVTPPSSTATSSRTAR